MWAVRYPNFRGGARGRKHPRILENHAKKRVPNRTRRGRCGGQSGDALPAFRPLSRPFNLGQVGKPCGTASSWVGVQPINKNTSLVWYPFVRFPLSLAALRLPGCCLAAPWPPWLLPGCFWAAPCTGQLQDNYRTTYRTTTGQPIITVERGELLYNK